jgi:predicted alpha-1,2-mannosidase
MFGSPAAVWGSAATTLEYAVADFAIARFAAALGESAVAETFLARSASWKHLFNPETGHLQPRLSTGAFTAAFDPASGEGYVEGNGAQYTWMVPHDLAGLIAGLGGMAAARGRLDRFFAELNAGPAAPHAFLGNEPCAHTPWIYAWLGQPHRTQEIARQAIRTLFDASPGGYPGNDDVGQMSAWYVFAALGLYPAIPGTDVLVLGSPLFPRVTLRLPGKTITIVGRNAAPERPYVQRLTVDGAEHTRPWIRFGEIRDGARLVFHLASRPSLGWGSSPEDAPPSFGGGGPAGPRGSEGW